MPEVDATDARLLLALAEDPRASVMALSQRLGLARNTVQARLSRLESNDVLAPLDRRVRPEALGYRLGAYVTVTVVQRTDTALALRRFVEHRVGPLLERAAGGSSPSAPS